MDETFEGDWPELFGARSTELRSVFLGDPSSPDDGVVELVEMDGMEAAPDGALHASVGFFLLSLFADLDQVLPRLARPAPAP